MCVIIIIFNMYFVMGVMDHPIGHFITPLATYMVKQRSFTITAVITPQKMLMKHLCFYSVVVTTLVQKVRYGTLVMYILR